MRARLLRIPVAAITLIGLVLGLRSGLMTTMCSWDDWPVRYSIFWVSLVLLPWVLSFLLWMGLKPYRGREKSLARMGRKTWRTRFLNII